MLNITPKSISKYIDTTKYSSYKKLDDRGTSNILLKLLLGILLIFIASMFLPWTQNIRSKGYVTTLNPFDKPQDIQSLLGGKIKAWHVLEGDIVKVGDTIAIISESKEEYLDPELINNTTEQKLAKENSAESYVRKNQFLNEQLAFLDDNLKSKLGQLNIKLQQLDLKITTANIDLEAAEIYVVNTTSQLERMEKMYAQGIKSLTDLESKKLSSREALAKKNSVVNKLNELRNEKLNIDQQRNLARADVQQKIAKIESEIQTADSYRFSLLGETNKLQSKLNQLEQRKEAYVIKSPVAGRVNKVLKNGIGEFIKAQESIATIVPTDYKKAVELYITPNDMPLMREGKKVRLQFDGWPAVVFSGWPGNSIGTFGGIVYAIDNDISDNGKYRVLVVEDQTNEKRWPDLVRIGSGAQGLLLLNDVKVGYEIWRKLNGFPPDFYTPEQAKKVKQKAPIKKFK